MIVINDELAIPERELRFTASRSGGPGGQHVNKVATRVTLHYDIRGSSTLSDEQKSRIVSELAKRVSRDGVLCLHSGRRRSQSANRAAAIERFRELIRDALEPDVPRVPTRPSAGSRERRMEDKRRRTKIKQGRSAGSDEED